MRKINSIFLAVFLLSLLVIVSAHSASRIRNRALMNIVPSEQALLATKVKEPLRLRVPAVQSVIVTGASNEPLSLVSSGKAEIKNNAPYNIKIKQITCTSMGLGRHTNITFSPSLESRQRQTVVICYCGNADDISGLRSLKLQVKTSWVGGKATVEFDLPVERIQEPASTPSEPKSTEFTVESALKLPD